MGIFKEKEHGLPPHLERVINFSRSITELIISATMHNKAPMIIISPIIFCFLFYLYFLKLIDSFKIIFGIEHITKQSIDSSLYFNNWIFLLSFLIFCIICIIDFFQIKKDIEYVRKNPFILENEEKSVKESINFFEKTMTNSFIDLILYYFFISPLIKDRDLKPLQYIKDKIKKKQDYLIILLYQISNFELKFLLILVPILIFVIGHYFFYYWYEVIVAFPYFFIISLIIVIISLIIIKFKYKIATTKIIFYFLLYVIVILPFIIYLLHIIK